MQWRPRVILIVAAALALAACSSGSGGKRAATEPPAKSHVQARLLTATDVGSAWNPGQPVNEADLASVSQAIPCAGGAVEPAVAKRLTAVTGTQFEPADGSYAHLIELVMTGPADQLSGDLQALFAAMDSCGTQASASPDGTLTVTPLAVPKLGDQRAAYVMTGRESTNSAATWYVRNAVVRMGTVAVAIGLTEILPTAQAEPRISDAAFVRLLEKGVDKLRT